MKFAFLPFLLASVASAQESTYINVEADVDCGINFNSLSLKALGYSSAVIQSAFNAVHEQVDDGDIYINALHFDHVVSKKDSLQDDESNLRGSDKVEQRRLWGGYFGGWFCTLCPADDDSVELVSGANLQAWELSVAQQLLTSGHPEFSSVKECKISLFPVPEKVAAAPAVTEDEAAHLNVEVDIDCGLNYGDLSLKALGFSSMAVQQAYNKVHEETDGGDAFLADIHFDHTVKKKALGSTPLERRRLWGGYFGGWFCTLCPADDDATGIVGDSGAALRAWELKLASILMQSDFPEFKKVKTCAIQVYPVAEALADIEAVEDDATMLRVEVDIDCGFDFHKLSVADYGYSAMAIQKTYNKVHEVTDGGDAYLSGLHFDHLVKTKALETTPLERRRLWGGYFGGWFCTLCPADDDATGIILGDSGAALKQWETELAYELAKSSVHPIFGKVSKCDISVKAAPSLVADAESA